MARTNSHATAVDVTIAQLEAYINTVKYHDEPPYDMVRKTVLQYMVQRAYPDTTGNCLVKGTGTARFEGGQVGKCAPLGVLEFANVIGGLEEYVVKYLCTAAVAGAVWLGFMTQL
jgi:hypothetical protein